MKIPKVWIFDLDGVIVKTDEFHYRSWKELADFLDIPFNRAKNELLKGTSRKESLQKMLAMDNRSVSEEAFKGLMSRKNEKYLGYAANLGMEDLLEGIHQFLEQLKILGAKMAIGSSSRNAQHIIDHLQLNHFFSIIIDGKKVAKSKPDPEVFLKSAQHFKSHPRDCLVFEDAVLGVKAARNAGMPCIGVGAKEKLNEADLVISSFKRWTPQRLLNQMNKQSV